MLHRVIKTFSRDDARESSRPSVKPAVTRQFRDGGWSDPVERARQEAEIILRTARSEQDSIRSAARDDGHQDGYRQGYSDGARDGAAKASELIERLESMLSEMTAERARLAESVEAELLKLCVETVEKIIRHEVKTRPEVVKSVIKSCLKRVRDTSEVSVRVSPSEVEAVKAGRDELLSAADGLRAIKIVDDRRVSPGGCVIETNSGDFDARVETQIDRVRKRLAQTQEGRNNDAGDRTEQIPPGDQPDGHDTA